MASEPRFSISPLCELLYRLDGTFAAIDIGRQLPGFDFIFRSALGLDFGGSENPVFIEFSISQRLGPVLESVGKRLGTRVGHFEAELVLDQGELNFLANPVNRTRFDIAANPDLLAVSLIAHLTQLT